MVVKVEKVQPAVPPSPTFKLHIEVDATEAKLLEALFVWNISVPEIVFRHNDTHRVQLSNLMAILHQEVSARLSK